MATGNPTGNKSKAADIASPYVAKNNDGQPKGLTLEKLRLAFQQNVYFAGTGQGWFEWGVSWKQHKSYSKLSDFDADLGIDQDSRTLDPGFANLSALDLRLKPELMAALRQNYPQEPVPGVTLGMQP